MAGGDMTGEDVRMEIQRLMDAGWSLAEIGARVDRDASTLGAIRSGEIANPPEELLANLRKLKGKKDEC